VLRVPAAETRIVHGKTPRPSRSDDSVGEYAEAVGFGRRGQPRVDATRRSSSERPMT
jgi:hypothetical protein